MENKNEWRKIKLGEITTITMGQSPKSEFYNLTGEGMPFLQGNRTFGKKFPFFDTYTTKITKTAQKNDTIMSVRAPVGDLNLATTDICLGRGVCSLRMNNGNYEFLFYLLKYYSKQLSNNGNGTVFSSINRNEIYNLEINIPTNEIVQRKIAKILSDIDKKMELNNKINNNLEEQAELIFNNYFLENSSSNILKEDKLFILSKEIICGKTPSTKNKEFYGTNIPFITIPDMHNKVYIDSTERLLSFIGADSQKNKYLPINTICVSCIGTAGLVSLTSKLSQTNQQINSIIPKTKELTYYIYFLMRNLKDKINLIGASGSTFCNLNKKDFSNILVPIPKDDILKQFYYICLPIFENIKNNQIENEKLNNLKNYLLPKLMNGEIDVEKIEL